MSSSSETTAKSTPQTVEVRTLGKYELQRQLGAGGMGTVYLAKDVQLKRLVALKILPQDKAKNPTLVRRFLSEAQASAQLRHENIVAVYENGEIDGHLFIAMEYVDGTDLHELIRKRGRIPVKRSLEIIKQVAIALQHAAEHRIVHRDIKPSNLLIRNDGLVKLTDLGLARSVDDTLETDITRAGTTVGTVDYMSPEQGRNSKLADIRSDLYSLGCTWYHMLTGKTPFPEGSMTNKLQAHASKPPPDPRALNDHVTESMVAVLLRLMAKKPEDRYQTPAELLKDLARPSMTRSGGAEEMLSTLTEEGPADVTESQRMKRQTPLGAMPPKKAAKVADKEESPGFDWETIRPLAFGIVVLIGTIGVGIVIAGFSGGLNFGDGPVTLPDKSLRPHDDGTTVVQSPQVQGAASPNAAPAVMTPETKVATLPDGTTPAEPGQAAPTKLDPGTGNTTVMSPGSSNPAAAGNSTGTSPGSIAQASRTFDAESIPAWSTSSGSRGPNGTGPATPNGTPTPNGASPKAPSTPAGTPTGRNVPGMQLANLTVGPGAASKSHFPDLSAALKSLSREGAIITLRGAGPFVVPEISLRQIQRLVLQAAEGPRPILLVRPAEGQLTAGLTLAEGILELEGLDLVLDRSAFAGSDPVHMVASIDGQLLVRNSTFTAWGAGTVPIIAVQVDSQLEPKGLAPNLEPRVLLDRVCVRGDDVTALAIARPNADVVVRDSLLIGGSQPVITLSGTLPELLASTPGQRPRRAVRIVQSTLFARRTGITFSADAATVPPSTTLLLQDSLCATAAGAESNFLDVSTWAFAEPDAVGGKLKNLNVTMKESLVLGFSKVVNLGANSAFQVLQPSDWPILWKRENDLQQFAKAVWPASIGSDLSAISVRDFRLDPLPAGVVAPADGIVPGCDVSQLPELSAASRRWLTALSARPNWPDSSFPTPPPQVVKFDVSKQPDFGVFLQQGDWPAGTLIEVTGSGLRPMSPVKLTRKNWKIVGKPQEGVPLAFTPKSVSSNLASLLTVDGGDVELVNLRFQLPASKKTNLTSLIAGQGSRLTLQNVSLQGVWSDTDAIETLLSWTGISGGSPHAAPMLVCRDCLLTNGGSTIRIDLGSEPVFLGNSLLVSREHALDLRLGVLPAGQAAGPLVVDHVTLSAAQSALHVQSSSPAAGQGAHRLYVNRCVFAPPLTVRSDDGAATVLRLADTADLARIEWWGTSNGIAEEIASLVRGDAEPAASSPAEGLARWQATWSAEQDHRLLTGAGGVVLKPDAGNSKPGTIKPSQFALDSTSKAKRWGDDGSAIGADIQRIDLSAPAAKPKDGGKTPVTPKRPMQADF